MIRYILILSIFILSSCNKNAPINDSMAIYKLKYENHPLKYKNNYSVNFKDLKKFTLSDDSDSVISFPLICALEEKGYIFVDNQKEHDFIVSIIGQNNSKKIYFPPAEEKIKQLNNEGIVEDFELFTPGRLLTIYSPDISIKFINKLNEELLYEGHGKAESENADFEVASQMMIRKMLEPIPECSLETPMKNLGIGFKVFKEDNSGYFPHIVHLNNNNRKRGLKYKDKLLEYAGINLKNLSPYDIAIILNEQSNDKKELKVLRKGKTISSLS
jgi:hypothetical protein